MKSVDDRRFQAVMDAVVVEMHHSENKHGHVTRDPVRRCGIIGEELGEAFEQALKLTSPDRNELLSKLAAEKHAVAYQARRDLLYHEVAQIAGYAIRVLMEMERERGN